MNSLNLTILLFRAQNYSLIMSVCGKSMAQIIPWGILANHLAFLTLPPILRDEIPSDYFQEGEIWGVVPAKALTLPGLGTNSISL